MAICTAKALLDADLVMVHYCGSQYKQNGKGKPQDHSPSREPSRVCHLVEFAGNFSGEQ